MIHFLAKDSPGSSKRSAFGPENPQLPVQVLVRRILWDPADDRRIRDGVTLVSAEMKLN